MSIKVLWLEDEYKDAKLIGTIQKAKKMGFDIVFCEFASEFITQIDSVEWDAIILDVIGKKDNTGTLGSTGFNQALDKILAEYKNDPWFVFSGQAEITKADSEIRERLDSRHLKRNYADVMYIKGYDNNKLFADIKNAVENIEDWQIRNRYADIFATSVNKTMILKVLKSLDHHEEKDTALLNDARKILEDIFDECANKKLFETAVREMNDRARRLSGHTSVPKYIQQNILSVNFVSQEGSHSRSKVSVAITSGQAPYLIRSTINNLLNIILWWDQYKKENN